MNRAVRSLAPLMLLAACHSGTGGNGEDPRPFSGIAAEESVRFTGTEPFWGGTVAGDTLTYTTPQDQAGQTIAVDRFAGRNGVSWIGELAGQDFVLAVTPGDCSDGMSSRRFPYSVLLKIGEEQRQGCAWTDRQPYTGPAAP